MLTYRACEPGTAGVSHAAPVESANPDANNSSGCIAFLLVSGVIVAVIVFVARERAKDQKLRDVQAIQVAQTEFAQFQGSVATGRLPNCNQHVVGVLLKPEEVCCAISWGVRQIVPH